MMIYQNMKRGVFLSRPNRFIANVEVGGHEEVCHVKNTGRCKELLVPGATVFVQEADNSKRKTRFSVISVMKGKRLINMDSQAPNKVFYEWVLEGNFMDDIVFIKPEARYKNSRFDFYIETQTRKIFVEVKGVTLEGNGVAMFPDAPTERGVKHVNELCACTLDGYEAYIVFVIQMKGVKYFIPNMITHEEFGIALGNAAHKGVNVIALDCVVTENSLEISNRVPIHLP